MKIIIYLFSFFAFFFSSNSVFAQNSTNQFTPEMPQEEVYVAKVIKIIESGKNNYGPKESPYQTVKVKITSKSQKGKELIIDHGKLFTVKEEMLVSEGEKIVLLSFQKPDGSKEFTIVEKYRLDKLIGIT